ncbi:MAG TPA: AI-2E family transporter [Pyrinomonadaceae bacterium]|nr:AI-2E family transporter [Pyrinomonadaceae bacterium]
MLLSNNPKQKMAEQIKEKEVVDTAAVAAAEASWPQTRAILRIIFIVLAVAAVIWMLYTLEQVLLLVVLAIFFAYLVAPLVEFVRRPVKWRNRERLLPRPIAIGIVYLVIFGGLGLATYLSIPKLGDQISQFAEQAPTYLLTARGRAAKLSQLYQRLQLPPSAREAVNNAAMRAIGGAESYLTNGLSSVAGVITYLPWLVLIPILAFFLLKDADDFRKSALDMLPRGRLRWRGDEFFQDVNSTLAAYIRAQLTACLIIGVVCTIGFWLIGIPYYFLLGLIAGLLEFIPLAGPLVVAVLVAVIASFYSPGQVIAVIVFLGVLRIIHDYVIYPRIIGQGIHLHPLAVVLAILCGEELAGLAGIFLAIPVVAIISVTYRHWREHRGSAGLVAELLKPADKAPPSDAANAGSEELPAPPQTALRPSLTGDGRGGL